MISLEQYWMGRDHQYAADLTHEIIQNAQFTLERVNAVLELAAADGVEAVYDDNASCVASGWRPAAVNGKTQGAAKKSSHMVGLGVDIRDRAPDRPLARWALRNVAVLEAHGLWMEDPRWTWYQQQGGQPWVHWQARSTGSNIRVFIPSNTPPLAAALPEQLVA